MKLEIELVPKTCWFSNLRSLLSSSDWDRVRRAVYAKASNVCEICGGKGRQHPVECHEKWEYLEKKCIQVLVGLEALCPACHECKHIGLAQVRGREEQATKHLAKVNGISHQTASEHVVSAFETWSRRSCFDWKVDLSWLKNEFGIVVK